MQPCVVKYKGSQIHIEIKLGNLDVSWKLTEQKHEKKFDDFARKKVKIRR